MNGWQFSPGPFLVAGPCLAEEGDLLPRVAGTLAEIGERLGLRICLKASFDKANRSRSTSPRGPGLERGLALLALARKESGLPVLTDVHEPGQAQAAAEVADALQVPAFLCRQTDLLVACGRTGKPVNLKKGQWMAPEDMAGAVEKVRQGGGNRSDVAVTERGTFFGYGDLVVDLRSIARLRAATGVPVLFDATHAVQRPGRGTERTTGGNRDAIPPLLGAAAAAGVDGFYLETHPDPGRAPSDPETQWPLDQLEALMARTLRIWRAAREGE
ncbi:MAG TPA: 3-deoxy-8-phosphooctulonate synthase [Gemmatimonadales bacterium]|nr:3-deoxy-8-phosphooctulonate synthase [Gemmatimonadales bacterium]